MAKDFQTVSIISKQLKANTAPFILEVLVSVVNTKKPIVGKETRPLTLGVCKMLGQIFRVPHTKTRIEVYLIRVCRQF